LDKERDEIKDLWRKCTSEEDKRGERHCNKAINLVLT
jgi:hypothetical protein